ncbi:MAG: type I-C CRISPR-associated protein Cas5 [Candidatus Syntrophonatronum acetioxidans]|uniref:pre-crRNA processing endonuclease n=1 Tax=Candidatus Syntrophonatronum acetioxidans TaxID=1795816 RepID=A0A424YGP5_9FIRM|nr:MAG: type I-C CRISPR-associated protein Cas5 [Candidatus Syntrophonatronum acetioxidans]
MGFGIQLHVWGDYACFTRPEMKSERVSYDVITPSAARGIIEAIHWKPAIRWVIDRIHVLNSVHFDNMRRNEVGSKIPAGNIKKAMKGTPVILCQNVGEDRQQRSALLLRDVGYVIEAHFELTGEGGPEETTEKHYNMFLRRARKGQCAHQPYLGCREFPAKFRLIEGDEPIPNTVYFREEEKDLGWMLLDIDYTNDMNPVFFRAIMERGVIDVPPMERGGTL